MCTVCCGPAAGHALCFACRAVGARLGLPLAAVVPVRLCPLPGPLYSVLMGYKESPVDEARRRYAPMLRQLLADFLASHAACVAAAAGGPLDLALPVPSSVRPGGSPLCAVTGLADAVEAALPGARWSPSLLRRTAAPIGHMRADARAFGVAKLDRPAVAGRRVLLLDDTYVSGARAQSAAAALRRAGARGAVVVALGRVLRPDRLPGHAAFVRAHTTGPGRQHGSATPPTWCCRCVQAGAPTR